ncbi:MAG: bi-domain-containing oxidoreductase [Candidatus Cloacimonadales bacterium]|nr:bi-domain-containing oxidoreductase [Candidatus Cloacimonadales bacterium]
MLQVIVKKGIVFSDTIPAPKLENGRILIRVENSCISTGTEISNVNISSKSISQRLIEKPVILKRAFDKIQDMGFRKYYQLVKEDLGKSSPSGYSLSGIVIGLGQDTGDFKIGDKVAAAGGVVASHAEIASVPKNLVVKMPNNLDFELASSVAIGATALQGVRRADLKIGEFCVVVGAGMLGMITIQMLTNSGIRVAAVDINDERLKLCSEFGVEIEVNSINEDSIKVITHWSDGYGADAVIFTAATPDNKPLSDSFQMCKRKGKVILVGVSGMNIDRKDIYEKELDFLISTSYGPGRYDDNYEAKGNDYPYGYVRWTENRNMAEYLRMLQKETVNLAKMLNAIYPIEKVSDAFQKIKESKPLMIILSYKEKESYEEKVVLSVKPVSREKINIAIVGVGSFALSMLLPILKKEKSKFNIHAIMNRTGFKAKDVSEKYGAKYSTTDFDEILTDKDVDLVLISTRHDSHAELTLKALQAGKNVFVEKPLATNQTELNSIKEFYLSEGEKPLLFVGYNRRFSKYAQEINKYTSKRINPLFIHYRMNAGYIPMDHWVHQNGGRIIGEACHIIDLMTFFTKSKIQNIYFDSLNSVTGAISCDDNKSIILKYEDGSIATIEYFAIGNKGLSKEYMEIHFDEKSIILDNYQVLKGFGLKINDLKSKNPEKGHLEEFLELYKTLKLRDSKWPIELWDMIQTTEITFLIK